MNKFKIKMILFLIFLLSSISRIEAKDFCEENNILKDTELNCINGQLLFGSFSFYSKEGQQKYEYDNHLKIKFVTKYKKQILAYLKKNCDLEKDIKIKKKENDNLQEIFYKGANQKGNY